MNDKNNVMLAKYLGWYSKESDTIDTYYRDLPDGTTEVVYSDYFKFDTSWDLLMLVLEKIHKDYYKHNIAGRDLRYTMKILLGGGYFLQNDVCYPTLDFTLENLYSRVCLFLNNKIK